MKLWSLFHRKPQATIQPLMTETKMEDVISTSSPEVLRSPVARAIDVYKKLQAAHAAAAAKIVFLDREISDRDAVIAAHAVTIAELKAALDETWPEDAGGSMGGVV